MDTTQQPSTEQQTPESTPLNPDELVGVERAAAPTVAEKPSSGGPGAIAQAQAQVASTDDPTSDDATTDDQTPATPPPPPEATANDADVIEPAWVQRAQDIVAKHRDDPHTEEEAVEELQAEYLHKRFNIDVKQPDE